MAPKAKAKLRPKAKAKAGVARPKRAAAMRVGVLRRPAARAPIEGALGVRERWIAGEELELHRVPLDEMTVGSLIEVTEGSYFGAACKAAGTVQGIDVKPEATHVLLKVTGTTGEGLLKHQSGHPGMLLRVHRCTSECTADRHAEDLLHGLKARKPGVAGAEEGWLRNLEIAPAEDELATLRARGSDLAPGQVGSREDAGKGVAEVEKKEEGTRKKDAHKKKKKKGRSLRHKKKKKSEERDSPSPGEAKGVKAASGKKKRRSTSSSSSGSVALDGRKPRAASTKTYDALYAGTGLDRREKVRRRVLKRAKKAASQKSKDKSKSGSDSGSSEEDSLSEEELEDTLFQGESKIQRVGQRCPGALACQAITTMKSNLLQETGATGELNAVEPVAMLYLRQHLHRRASGPALRELVTLAIAVDQLLRARPSRALDTLLQRFKAVEAGLMGAHWSVAQRLELGPAENLSLTGQEELSSAQKDAYTDARTKMLAGLPDGRSRTSKGQGKTKDKDDFRKDRDKGRGKGATKDRGKPNQKEDHPSK